MNWERLLTLVGNEPVFSSALLLAGHGSASQVHLQLTRWVKAGRLMQLRRGVYALTPAWRKVEPHPFVVANRLQRGSYVSLQAAMAFFGIIPEHVPAVTSVSPGRRETVKNDLGSYQFNHIGKAMLFGYSRLEVAPQQFAFTASPEKALLDLVYLTPGADSPDFIRELRLQNTEAFELSVLQELALKSGKPKLIRTARLIGPLLPVEGESSL
ncbi:hypothetical protein MUP29_02055 [bacterium]|nr:hypothetical protein [bacterium]